MRTTAMARTEPCGAVGSSTRMTGGLLGSFTRASIAPDVAQQARPPGLSEDLPPPPIALRDVARLALVIPGRPNASACMWNQKWPVSAAGP